MIGSALAKATTWCAADRGMTSSSSGGERTRRTLAGETTNSTVAPAKTFSTAGEKPTSSTAARAGMRADGGKRFSTVSLLGFDWDGAAWDGSHKGKPLDLTGYAKTFEDNFGSLSTITDGATGAGPWYAPARPDTSLAQFLSPLQTPGDVLHRPAWSARDHHAEGGYIVVLGSHPDGEQGGPRICTALWLLRGADGLRKGCFLAGVLALHPQSLRGSGAGTR